MRTYRYFERPCMILASGCYLVYGPLSAINGHPTFWGWIIGTSAWLLQGYILILYWRYIKRRAERR